MSAPGEVVAVEGLSFRYGRSTVLEQVGFSVKRGESTCIIGPNGGGKSTLLKLLLGLLEPGAGTIRVLGRPPRAASPRVGYVPQFIRFDPFFPISVMEVVLMGRLDRFRAGFYSRRCRESAREALERVGLGDLEKRPFSELSGGQRQRVLIARALASGPELMLLDEPTANIDLSVEAQFLETLASLRESMTVLLVTHDLDVVSQIGESVLCVNHRVHRHGLPLQPGTVAEIFSGARRVEHDRRARHARGDHSSCDHE